jgi:hypothetical protein
MIIAKRLDLPVKLKIYSREVLSTNLDWDIGYPDS